MKKTLIVLLSVGIFAIQPACYYGNEEELYGTSDCNTANMRFSVEVTQIMNNKCIKCHVEDKPEFSGIKMDTYEDWKKYATNGRLINRVFDAASPMPPKTEGIMSDCDKAKLKAWVEQGALDN